MHHVSLETVSGQEDFRFPLGQVCLIVGPNGVGKSALIYQLYRAIGHESATYIPGHRSITFTHGYDNMQMGILDLERNLYSQTEAFNRYKSQWSEEQFKSVVRRIHHAQTSHNEGIIQKIRQGEDGPSLVRLRTSPLDVINHTFSIAGMAVSFKMTDDGIQVRRDDAVYSVDKLSDGERAALFIAGAIAVTPRGRTLLIDEPERHLHPSISAPLVATAVRSRPELSFVFASHDLNLIQNLEAEQIFFVKNSFVTTQRPEMRLFDIKRIEIIDSVSDDLKKDILGVRDRVLFVEGEATSLDRALYAAVYPNWKVAPRGGADKVIEAASALQENSSLHWMQAVGLIDGDGRSDDEKQALKRKKIEVLNVPTVENLFFLRSVICEFSKLMSELEGGDSAERVASVENGLREIVVKNRDEIVARRATWFVNRQLSELKVSVRELREGSMPPLNVDVAAVKEAVDKEFNDFLEGPCGFNELETLPIKATGIPAQIARLAGAASLKKYKQIILQQVEMNSPPGERILASAASKLPVLG